MIKNTYTQLEKDEISKRIRNYTDEDVLINFKNLQKYKITDKLQTALMGLKVVDRMTFTQRLETTCIKKKTMGCYYDFFFNRELYINKRQSIRNFIEYYKKKCPKATLEHTFYEMSNLYLGSINAFKPGMSKYIYSTYNARNILDFSAGWGGRLIGAMSIPNTNYIGIDTNEDLKKGYDSIIKLLNITDRVTMIWGDSSQVDYSKLKYDFVFTSPPYFNIEVYKHMPDWRTRDDFNNKFWFPVLRKVWDGLELYGTMMLNIPINMLTCTITILGEPEIKFKLLLTKRSNQSKYEEFIYGWIKRPI